VRNQRLKDGFSTKLIVAVILFGSTVGARLLRSSPIEVCRVPEINSRRIPALVHLKPSIPSTNLWRIVNWLSH
jgi:hypothetical protein